MKIVILSDSHGYPARIRRVMEMHRDADFVCFLGDGLSETRIVERAGHRLLLTHGHRFGAKGGTGGLIAAARAEGCDIVLFGHTHLPLESYVPEYGMYLFNPGSLGHPREGVPSFGLLMLDGKNVLFSHGRLSD